MGMNSGNNPEIVKTSLDEVLYTRFDEKPSPDQTSVRDDIFWKQESIDRQAVIYAEYQPPTEFTEHAEEETINQTTIRTDNKTTTDILNYKNSVPIPVEFFEDDQHSEVQESIKQFGRKARNSQEKFGVEKSYGNGFTVTTPDGAALFSNSHTSLSGDTIDNLETGAMAPAALDTIIKNLELQKDQAGELGGHSAAGVLVPRALYKTTVEIMESELIANSAENNDNIFATKYGTLKMASHPRLDSTYNSLNSNADTSYFVVSKDHRISRTVRLGLTTSLVSPETDMQDRWFYKARYREVVVPKTWEGTMASNGIT